MYEAMMIAATGLTNQQRRLDTIAHNVSNVNTVAYKSARLDFKDALYTAGILPALPRTPEGNQQHGHGVMVAGITKSFAMGNIQTTERPLDLAIEGEGFFELEDSSGNSVYTRNGNFYLDDLWYLVNDDGLFVLDTEGERISAPYGTYRIDVSEDGRIAFSYGEELDEEIEPSVALGIYTFRNITGLLSVGGSNYSESPASGTKMRAENAHVRQGMLEMSNVSLSEEMTRLIRTQRTFQLSSRALTTADQMEGIANNLRK